MISTKAIKDKEQMKLLNVQILVSDTVGRFTGRQPYVLNVFVCPPDAQLSPL